MPKRGHFYLYCPFFILFFSFIIADTREEVKQMFQSLHPNIQLRIVIQFLSKVVSSMIFPFIAIYYTEKFGASIAGVLVLVNVIVSFLAGIYGGHLTDVFGRKKLMVIGESIKLVAQVGMVIVNSPWLQSPISMYVLILVTSITSGLIAPASEAMLVDVSTEENRSFMYSMTYWTTNVSLLIGMTIGGWLFQSHLMELLLALVLLSIVTWFITWRFISETYQPTEKKTQIGLRDVLRKYREVAQDRRFLLFTIGGILILGIEFQRTNVISVHMANEFVATNFFGTAMDGVKALSLMTAINTLMVIFFSVPVGQWLNRFTSTGILYVGFLLFGAGYALNAVAVHLPLIIGATILLTIGELIYTPKRQAIMAQMVDYEKRGSYLAFNGIIFQLGKVVAAMTLMFSHLVSTMVVGLSIFGLAIAGSFFTYVALRKE